MVYVTVKEESEDRLYLTRQPSLNSWAILVGFSSVGLGIAYYGNDACWMKAVYIILGTLVGISCLEDWEECDFDKKTGEVRLKKTGAWDRIFLKPESVFVAQMSEIVGIGVNEEKVNFFGTTYQVVLEMATGMSIGITESFTFGSSRDHHKLAEKIRKFLDIEGEAADNDFVESSTEDDNTDNDTADDFEHIEQSDVVDETEDSALPPPDSPSEPCDPLVPSVPADSQ